MSSSLPLRDRARGRWLGILPALGISESFLTGKHGPCPLCGGKDRWRWDNREGRGTWICSGCGAGDGISLVMQKNRCEFREAAKQIEALIGSVSADAPKRERSDRQKREAMSKLWQSAKAVEENDPVGRYLAWRVGLTSFPNLPANRIQRALSGRSPLVPSCDDRDGDWAGRSTCNPASDLPHRRWAKGTARGTQTTNAGKHRKRGRCSPRGRWRCPWNCRGDRNRSVCFSTLRSAMLGSHECRHVSWVAAASLSQTGHYLRRQRFELCRPSRGLCAC